MNEGFKPKVTVITVCRNCKNDIRETMESVLAQDYPNLEYLIIDGASTDGTLDIVNEYADRLSLIVSEPDNGVYDAMNKGVRFASGSWINFMNAGDYYADSHSISALFEDIECNSDKKVIYGNTLYVERNGVTYLHHTSTLERLAWTICRYQPYTHQAVFYNIECKEDCLYDTRYRISADYDVACKYWRKYGQVAYYYVPVVVCSYKAYDGVSSTPSGVRRSIKEMIFIKVRHRMGIMEIMKDIVRFGKLKLCYDICVTKFSQYGKSQR